MLAVAAENPARSAQMNNLATFFYAWAQVTLICLNTWQIANCKFVGALIVGFLISLVWTFNVRRAVFGCWKTRIIYAVGASCGTATGLLLSIILYH